MMAVRAIGAGGVDVRALRAQQAHGGGVVAGFRRVEQRRVIGGAPCIERSRASRTSSTEHANTANLLAHV